MVYDVDQNSLCVASMSRIPPSGVRPHANLPQLVVLGEDCCNIRKPYPTLVLIYTRESEILTVIAIVKAVTGRVGSGILGIGWIKIL